MGHWNEEDKGPGLSSGVGNWHRESCAHPRAPWEDPNDPSPLCPEGSRESQGVGTVDEAGWGHGDREGL